MDELSIEWTVHNLQEGGTGVVHERLLLEVIIGYRHWLQIVFPNESFYANEFAYLPTKDLFPSSGMNMYAAQFQKISS